MKCPTWACLRVLAIVMVGWALVSGVTFSSSLVRLPVVLSLSPSTLVGGPVEIISPFSPTTTPGRFFTSETLLERMKKMLRLSLRKCWSEKYLDKQFSTKATTIETVFDRMTHHQQFFGVRSNVLSYLVGKPVTKFPVEIFHRYRGFLTL